jgi:hypothetical protein
MRRFGSRALIFAVCIVLLQQVVTKGRGPTDLAGLISPARAQESTEVSASDAATTQPSEEATPLPIDTIFIKPQQSEEIQKLLKLYQDQVEKYSVSEREYRTAKAQFFKLETLQSLEEAITKTRQVMLDRDDVLITYAELVRAHLQDTDGVEISLKTAADSDLEALIIALKEHREKVAATKDREEMKRRAQEFALITKAINERLSVAISLISLGDLQTIYDRNKLIYTEIKQLHTTTPTSALRQEERERAYREVDQAVEKVRLDLEVARISLQTKEGKARGTNSESITKFKSISAGHNRVLDYLKELLLELT